MQEFDYLRPRNVAELKENLSQPGARILAGGTDIIPQLRRGKSAPKILVDTSGIRSLRFIEDQGDRVVIGAMTTHQEIAESQLVSDLNPALRIAAESVGSTQTRCRGTLGGNIANASPAADTLPPLLVYEASVLIQNLSGEREVPLESLVIGPGQTALEEGEFIHSISFRPLTGRWGSHFIKVGKRKGMAISVVNAAATVVLDKKGSVSKARVALGAVGPVVIRCRETESSLCGKVPDRKVFEKAGEQAREEVRPITDIRSTEEYRLHAAGVIVARVLEAAAEQARGRMG